MATRLEGLYINITSNDASYLAHPEYYIKFEDGADKLVFSVSQPASLSESDLNAVQTIIIPGYAEEIENLYLWDNSDGIFKHIPLSGSGAYQHVFCLHMTGTGGTLSEPTVQAWDTSAHTTANLVCLGAGDFLSSYIHVIETRLGGRPSDTWVGTLISGTHGIGLNGGNLLTEATDLYFNMYVKIPANVAGQEVEAPVFCFRYLYGD
jgi:hypothetical protein